MPEIESFDTGTPLSDLLSVLARDGALILRDVIDGAEVESILAELGPFIESTAPLKNDFAGRQTTRTGALVARSKGARAALTHPAILPVAKAFLEPHCDRIQLNLTQIIRLLPGQGEQELHRDRFIWGRYLPREVEPQLNTLWALSDFTEENGATWVVPASQHWDWDRPAARADGARAAMSRGSVLVYSGSVIHGAGRNEATEPRIGMNLTYLVGWLRQEENQYLSCPPEIARQFEPELQELLGYTMGNYALGYFSPPEFTPGQIDTLPPEGALGRRVKIDEPKQVF